MSEVTNTSNVPLGITDIQVNDQFCFIFYGSNGGANGGASFPPPNGGGYPPTTCSDDPSTELDPDEHCVITVLCED